MPATPANTTLNDKNIRGKKVKHVDNPTIDGATAARGHVENLSEAADGATAVQGGLKRKATAQGGMKTKKATPMVIKSAATTDKSAPADVRVPLKDVTRKPNEGRPSHDGVTRKPNEGCPAHDGVTRKPNEGHPAHDGVTSSPEPARAPNGKAHLPSNTEGLSVDLEAEKARIFKEANEKIRALERAQQLTNSPADTHNPGIPKTPKIASRPTVKDGADDTQTSVPPKKQWPPVRKHNRGQIPSQYLNIPKPAAQPSTEPPLTIQSLDGKVEKVSKDYEPILRPRGEAGDGKRGFCLQEAVELDDGSVSNDVFADFLACVRTNATLARVDLTKTFRQQDPDVISLVCRKTALDMPYFGKQQFPGYWPTREALKQYIKNQRKYMARQRKARLSGKRQRENNPFRDTTIYLSDGYGDDAEEDEDDNGAGPSGTHHDEDD
ncbi:hypothetical protein EV360DRAFT_76523 [Lentinula raphanica]|nr:hypothetical protein EV360DRAFT_76523 [Lentinula raphanica]